MSISFGVQDMHLPTVWVDGDVVDDQNPVLDDGPALQQLARVD